MNILFLSTENPFPADHGHHIRTSNVLKHLAQHHKIHFIGFVKSETEQTAPIELQELCAAIELFALPYTKNRFWFFSVLIQSLLKGLPFTVHRYFNKKVVMLIEKIIQQESIDLVHVDMLHLAIYRKYLLKPAILTNHNVEFLRLKRWMRVEKNVLIKILLFIQYHAMKRFERKMCGAFSKCIAVSEYDKNTIEKLTGKKNIVVIPNGVDTTYFAQRNDSFKTKSLVWIGAMTNAYNRDGVIYFIDEIWPLLKAQISDVKSIFVGADPPSVLTDLAQKDPSVSIVGYVDDVRPFMSPSNIFIAPLRSGSGTKIKVLNAMSMGIPVVTTPVGAEGLEVQSGENILIAENARDFASQVAHLWLKPEFAERIGKNGRKTVVKKYDWAVVLKDLETLYHLTSKNALTPSEPKKTGEKKAYSLQ